MDHLPRPPKVYNPGVQLRDPSTIDYESADEIDASDYQVLWSNIMDKGKYIRSPGYNKVAVLLLCWHQTSGDLATQEEVDKLKAVFEEDFGYSATIAKLDANREGRLQIDVNAKVAKFAKRYDGPQTLLIVYYAGHGKPGRFFGDLDLFGQTSPNDRRDAHKQHRDRLVWNKTENLLRPAEADILEIFDYCYAGTLGLTRGEDRRFEYLAAAKDQATTAIPGQQSFTSALIYALKYLRQHRKEGRFTTDELLRTIKNGAPHFPKDQEPMLSERGDLAVPGGRIMLQPLRRDETISHIPNERGDLEAAKKHTVTLHFDFGAKPAKDHLETLGVGLNSFFERNTLEVHRVRWGSMRASMIARAARRFQAPLRRRASKKEERIPQEVRTDLLTIQTASSSSLHLLSPPATGYNTHDSAGDTTGGDATSSQACSVDSSEDTESMNKRSRKRRRSAGKGGSVV